MKNVHYDQRNGMILGYYAEEIHSSIPTPNIEVDDIQWQDALNVGANYIDANTKVMSVYEFREPQQVADDEANALAEQDYLAWIEARNRADYAARVVQEVDHAGFIIIGGRA